MHQMQDGAMKNDVALASYAQALPRRLSPGVTNLVHGPVMPFSPQCQNILPLCDANEVAR